MSDSQNKMFGIVRRVMVKAKQNSWYLQEQSEKSKESRCIGFRIYSHWDSRVLEQLLDSATF